MATPRVFITRRIHSRAEEVLRTAECEVRVAPEERPLTDAELRAGAANADAVLCLLQAAWAWQRRTERHGLPDAVDPVEGWIVSVPASGR